MQEVRAKRFLPAKQSDAGRFGKPSAGRLKLAQSEANLCPLTPLTVVEKPTAPDTPLPLGYIKTSLGRLDDGGGKMTSEVGRSLPERFLLGRVDGSPRSNHAHPLPRPSIDPGYSPQPDLEQLPIRPSVSVCSLETRPRS